MTMQKLENATSSLEYQWRLPTVAALQEKCHDQADILEAKAKNAAKNKGT
jgi:hypothetical protein